MQLLLPSEWNRSKVAAVLLVAGTLILIFISLLFTLQYGYSDDLSAGDYNNLFKSLNGDKSCTSRNVNDTSSSICLPCECPCDDGPYIYQRTCTIMDEGIGGKFQHFKTGLLLSVLTGFKYVADRRCFTESHNAYDYSDILGMYRTNRCDPCSLQLIVNRLQSYEYQNHSTSSMRYRGSDHGSGSGSGENHNDETKTVLRHSMMPVDINLAKTLYHNSDQRNLSCNSGKPLKQDDIQLLLSYYDEKLAAVKYDDEYEFAHSTTLILNNLMEQYILYTIYRHHYRSLHSDFERQGAIYSIQSYEHPALESGNGCISSLIHSKYEETFYRQIKSGIRHKLVFDPSDGKVNICLHFRWGDVATSNSSTQVDVRTGYTLPHYAELLDHILSIYTRSNHDHDHQTQTSQSERVGADIYFFAEGQARTEFPALQSLETSKNIRINYRFGSNAELLEDRTNDISDIDHMSHCDVLIGGSSSFYLLSTNLCGTDCIVVADPDHIKFPDQSSGKYQNIIDVRMSHEDITQHIIQQTKQLHHFTKRHQRFKTRKYYLYQNDS